MKEAVSSVYIVTNIITGEIYVGCSTNPDKRFKTHIERYNNPNSKEYNKPLYQAMRKYGEENFVFKVVEQCPHEERFKLESEYIDKLNTVNTGYNRGHKGESHGKSVLTNDDVIDIRTRYANHESYRDVYKLYSDKINESGFHKIWKGETWTHLMMNVYTEDNKDFHRHNTGSIGETNSRAILTEADIINIRTAKKEGHKMKDIYQNYKNKVTEGYFKNIWYNITWTHIKV